MVYAYSSYYKGQVNQQEEMQLVVHVHVSGICLCIAANIYIACLALAKPACFHTMCSSPVSSIYNNISCVSVCVCVCAGMFHPSCVSDVTRHHIYIYIHAHIPVMCVYVCVFETVGNPSSGSVSTELYSFIIK